MTYKLDIEAEAQTEAGVKAGSNGKHMVRYKVDGNKVQGGLHASTIQGNYRSTIQQL
jgi:hypothetical protein